MTNIEITKEFILDNAVLYFLPYGWEPEENDSIVYDRMIDDLPVRYFIPAEIHDNKIRMSPADREMLEEIGISHEELREAALCNLQRDTFSVASIENCISEQAKEYPGTYEAPSGHSGVYVIQGKRTGAAALLYPDILARVSKVLGGNLLIAPSSIHEVLCVSEEKTPIDEQDLLSIVSDVNESAVATEDRLSCHVYRYDCTDGKLHVITGPTQSMN